MTLVNLAGLGRAYQGYPPPVQAVRQWQKSYARRLLWTDAILVIVIVVTAYLARYGLSDADMAIPTTSGSAVSIDYR
ncbi:MAG: hypothetical protein LBH76_09865, partial [Propionibacteriaceae bacterium]|nr:hypothetical protein [Propionibacteriaceae bacterium]